MKKAIYFDMDGTIAGLFYVKGWKEMIDNENTFPYENARPLFKADEMKRVIEALKNDGYTIGIITYVAYDCTKEYANAIRKAKREWLKKFFPYATEIHMVKHTTPKWKVAKIKNAILVDDCKNNRNEWKWGETINAYRANLPEELAKLL